MSKAIFVLTVAILAASCSRELPEPTGAPQQSTFVGSDKCTSCHVQEFRQWNGSHHQLAMQEASSESVLGDFSDNTSRYFDSEARFFKKDGKFFVEIQTVEGDDRQYEVTHTFGVAPLQQYLVDGPRGRKQALQFAWDSRPPGAGGQRWFHLYTEEYIGSMDPLHWSGRYFNWNYMCAECHSTNVQLNYDLETDSFATTYDEMSVGCEACHGPGSDHIYQAIIESFDQNLGLLVTFDDRKSATWVMNLSSGISERSEPNHDNQEPESCGRCHSRRSIVSARYEYGTLLTNTHMPSLLEENLYYPDGRIQDEVYVYGSFVQSKMYAAGVTCSDCHNPHTGRLRAGPDPNETCSTCHLPARFATSEHNAEAVGDCIACHMTETTYMGVDGRRDHSFRIPGTDTDPSHYGAIIAAGRQGGANDQLIKGVVNNAFPPIARATMLSLLEPTGDAGSHSVLLRQLESPSPLVRIGALRALQRQAPEVRMMNGSHLLQDEVRAVRIEAALAYIDLRDLLPLEDARAFPDAIAELKASLNGSASMPDAALSLADVETRLGNLAAAAKMYKHALKVGDSVASIQHAYGLHLVRNGRASEALDHLKQATLLDESSPQFAYVYGVALNSLGDSEAALSYLQDAFTRFPNHFDIGWALATMQRDAGNRGAARSVAILLKNRFPDDARVDALAESLVD